jgi:hypothetical protein
MTAWTGWDGTGKPFSLHQGNANEKLCKAGMQEKSFALT